MAATAPLRAWRSSSLTHGGGGGAKGLGCVRSNTPPSRSSWGVEHGMQIDAEGCPHLPRRRKPIPLRNDEDHPCTRSERLPCVLIRRWLSGIPETEGFNDWMRRVVGRCGLVPLGPQESCKRDERHDGPHGEHSVEQQQSDMHWHRVPQAHPGSASATENQYGSVKCAWP